MDFIFLFLAQPSFLHGTHTKIGNVTEGYCDTSEEVTSQENSKRTKQSCTEKQANLSPRALEQMEDGSRKTNISNKQLEIDS